MENKRFTTLAFVLICCIKSVFAVKNASDQLQFSTITMLQEYIDISNMEVVDLIRSLALVVAFLAMVFGDCGGLGFKRGTEAAFLMFGIAGFFFPSAFIGYLVKNAKIDVIHELIQQAIGATLLSVALAVWHTRSESEQARGAASLTRFIAFLGMFILEANAHFSGKITFSTQHMAFLMLFLGLMIVAHGIHIYRHGDFGRHTVEYSLNSGINRHLLLDITVMTMGVILDMANTEESLGYMGIQNFKPDALHVHIGKVSSMCEFSMLLYAVLAIGFADENDKRRVFIQRLMLYGLAVPLMMLYQLKHTVFSTQALMLYAGFSGLMIINSLWALYGNPVAVLQQVASPQIDRVLRRRKDN